MVTLVGDDVKMTWWKWREHMPMLKFPWNSRYFFRHFGAIINVASPLLNLPGAGCWKVG